MVEAITKCTQTIVYQPECPVTDGLVRTYMYASKVLDIFIEFDCFSQNVGFKHNIL